jgi:hypothetical protein
MKRAHVRAREAKELDFRGLVILPGIDLAVVGAVFLDFLSLPNDEQGKVLHEIVFFQKNK